jgi:hypothetical protein
MLTCKYAHAYACMFNGKYINVHDSGGGGEQTERSDKDWVHTVQRATNSKASANSKPY